MDTRINKYNESKDMSRVSKNEKLYEQINSNELDNFSVRSNATVIGNQEREIDIEKIKKILDKRYNETPKRRSIRVEQEETETKTLEEPTKEYDLTKVLEKAKDDKEDSYEENRAKKLRNTQFDILNNLNIESGKEEVVEEVPKKNAEEDLMNLINTIAINESKLNSIKEENDPLDILSDLKGDDNTQVYESMKEEIAEENKEIKEIDEVKKEESIDESFYTSNLFKKKDFEDEDDFVEENKFGIGIKILIILLVIIFIVGIIIAIKSFL